MRLVPHTLRIHSDKGTAPCGHPCGVTQQVAALGTVVLKFFKHYFLCGPLFKVFNEFVTTFCLIHVSGFWPWGMWDLSSQTSDQTVLPALEAKVSARDSQGGPSPRPCPGLPGLSRFTPPPQHRPSSLSPCSACLVRVSPHGCSLFRQQRHLPQTPAQEPPCRVPSLCLSLGPAPSSSSQNILRDLGLSS